MLKGERNKVLHTLNWDCQRVAWKPFTEDNLDAPKFIGRVPVVLLEELLLEVRKLERQELSILGELWTSLCVSIAAA